jgi:hypothetical protein
MESTRKPKAEAAARHCLSLTVDVTLAFFDQYLRGKDHGLLDRVRESGSEITVRHYSLAVPSLKQLWVGISAPLSVPVGSRGLGAIGVEKVEGTWNVLITFVPSVTASVNQSQSSDADRT